MLNTLRQNALLPNSTVIIYSNVHCGATVPSAATIRLKSTPSQSGQHVIGNINQN